MDANHRSEPSSDFTEGEITHREIMDEAECSCVCKESTAIWRDEVASVSARLLSSCYRKLRDEARVLSQEHMVVIFSIPVFKRNAGRNNLWTEVIAEYTYAEPTDCQSVLTPLAFVDPILGDRVFLIVLPRRTSKQMSLRLKDGATGECDVGPCDGSYELPCESCSLWSIRDGCLDEGDSVFTCGFLLRLEAPGWLRPTLWYLNELSGSWENYPFMETCRSRWHVILLQQRRLHFTLVDGADRHRALPANGNFFLPFPGAFNITPSGQIVPIAAGNLESPSQLEPLDPVVFKLSADDCPVEVISEEPESKHRDHTKEDVENQIIA
ncbi:MAG: uncharacterized protein KVP18_004124 [Porospora cf. gigantea A]|uniref:uncharacterized protein n=1 Tax=Porospora cf. gigantea A TaxID=2853593 RepID=UPI003559C2B7|nr:MAG: hypothetical protein KVP18_004124 [Porospora cf. gigantea A]